MDNTWTMDSIDLNESGPKNRKSYRHIVVVIDNFSKFGWTVLLEK